MDLVSNTLANNAENRLSGVSDDIGNSESYLYDGDGVRVSRVRAGVATYLLMGGMYEISVSIPEGSVLGTKNYSRTLRWGFAFGSNTAAGQVIAVRDTDGLSTLLTDHLGSVLGERPHVACGSWGFAESGSIDGLGALVGEQRYLPFGEVRGDVGSNPAVDLSFTGQRALVGTGLIDYHARQYDPALRTFIQPDSVIPEPYDVQDWNRYAYVHGNPLRFTDPSGNMPCDGPGLGERCDGGSSWRPSQPPIVPPPTVVFAGSCGQENINKACETGDDDMSIWKFDYWGNEVDIMEYPGSKWSQSTSIVQKYSNKVIILIGYSAGADSALMYAMTNDVGALVLLGPTFTGLLGNGKGLDDSNPYGIITHLVDTGVKVVIVDDQGSFTEDYYGGKFPPNVMFVPFNPQRKHYGAFSKFNSYLQNELTPTNLNIGLKNDIWKFIVGN